MENIDISPYIEAGNIISPQITIDFQKGKVIGIHTDQAKSQYILKMVMKHKEAYVHIKDDQLYMNLTVKEHIQFLKKIYHAKESVQSLIHTIGLAEEINTKVKHLTKSQKQLLHYTKFIICHHSVVIIEEPLQNIEEHAKQIMIHILTSIEDKMIIPISNNLEDLIASCNEINRLDEKGLKLLDISNQEVDVDFDEKITPIRIEKIPTKKNDKIILFNPPEIDYIESVEGEVSVHVAGEIYPCSMTLTELEKRLVPFGFFRCHRSYIVNLQKVREIITWTKNSYSLAIETTEKTTVPLSKNKLSELKELIGI